MIKTNLFQSSDVRNIADQKGCFSVLEYEYDPSVTADAAIRAYYEAQMNVHKRQVIATLKGNGVILQAGAMQMMAGPIEASTNVKGVGDLIGKAFSAKVTKETAVKPRYSGNGTLVLEPTYKHILLEDVNKWPGGMVIEDGLFLACDDTIQIKTVMRQSLSSATLGNEGLFNSALLGDGIAVLESPVPKEELVVFDLENDVLKIDGSMAIAWSCGLQFTVERTTKTIVGSAASGEGLVNVYRGTGRVLVATVR